LPFKALMFLTLMRPSLVLFLVLWLKLVKDFLKVRCRLALLPFLISCLIWLDLVASLPLIKERILVIILLLHFLDRKSGSAGMPRPISYAVFCLKKKQIGGGLVKADFKQHPLLNAHETELVRAGHNRAPADPLVDRELNASVERRASDMTHSPGRA